MPRVSVGSVPVYFEGSYRGAAEVKRRDGSVATGKDGQALISVSLLMGQAGHESVQSVVLRRGDVPENIPFGEYIRVPGSVSVSKDGDRVYVSRWGNSVECPALEALSDPGPRAVPVAEAAG